MSFTTDFGDSEIDILVFNFFKLEFEWNSFTFYFDNYFIETIDIENEVFFIFVVLSRSEDDGNFQKILFNSLLDTLLIFDLSDLKGQNNLT
jgi:hypothetical protein